MTTKIDHAWTAHSCLRLTQAADAASGLRVAVEDMHGHLWADRLAQLNRAIADLQAVKVVVEKRIAEEPTIVRRAA